MSDISEARNQLLIIAKLADPDTAARIKQVIRRYMWREKPVRRAPQKPIFISPQMKANIRKLAANNPTMHINEIAAQYKINPGRVSEILNNKR